MVDIACEDSERCHDSEQPVDSSPDYVWMISNDVVSSILIIDQPKNPSWITLFESSIVLWYFVATCASACGHGCFPGLRGFPSTPPTKGSWSGGYLACVMNNTLVASSSLHLIHKETAIPWTIFQHMCVWVLTKRTREWVAEHTHRYHYGYHYAL